MPRVWKSNQPLQSHKGDHQKMAPGFECSMGACKTGLSHNSDLVCCFAGFFFCALFLVLLETDSCDICLNLIFNLI